MHLASLEEKKERNNFQHFSLGKNSELSNTKVENFNVSVCSTSSKSHSIVNLKKRKQLGNVWETRKRNSRLPLFKRRRTDHNQQHRIKDDWIDDWKKVDRHLFTYSAYWDDRITVPATPFVRVFGIFSQSTTLEHRQTFRFICLLNFDDKVVNGQVTVKYLDRKNYYMFEVRCKPPRNITVALSPKQVAVRDINSFSKVRWTRVHTFYKGKSDLKRGKITVCAKPFYGPYNLTTFLAEFIAFYKVVGVSHFFFYDFQTSLATRKMLDNVSKRGISMNILPWSLPFWLEGNKYSISTKNMHRIMRQDCTFRSMYRYEFIINVDVDEFIVPRTHRTLSKTLEDLVAKSSTFHKAYFKIHEVRFCLHLPSRPISTKMTNFISLTKLQRTPYNPNWSWRKSIFKPDVVVTSGIHKILKGLPGLENEDVDPNVALIHHYRSWLCRFKSGSHPIFDPYLPVIYGEKMLKYLNKWKDLLI
ncbi:uncharacterized protein LOC143245596 [Tachypleus tridentatus]|uniref:uncharacterized protein LOC143245596 n=1 Tax=Tachypleus tridentatus TaxID=6853 RepID=UPI003FD4A05A